MTFFYSIVSFCVTIGIVVTVHELGHYLTARWRGVAVETFSIGFGRPLASWYDRAGTLWKIGWIPLGGYVKMQDLDDHSLLSRVLVVLAGPVANFVLAMVLTTLIFMFTGIPLSKPIIGFVAPDSPAARAGLMPRDEVVMIDNLPVTSYEELRAIVGQRPGKLVAILIERDGAQMQMPTTLTSHDGAGFLGVLPATQSMGLTRALIEGPVVTGLLTQATVMGLFHISMADLSGPVGIAHDSGEAIQMGWVIWLWLLISLSVSLAVFNMIPLPIMDGGHLLYYLCEAILGRPLSQRIQSVGVATSGLLLFGLFVFVTWHDVARWLR